MKKKGHRWFQKRFSLRNSPGHQEIAIVHSPSASDISIITHPHVSSTQGYIGSASPHVSSTQGYIGSASVKPISSNIREEKAAITIQTRFRSHLARRAFHALRSLVKLQALVRGVLVRRQARIAIQCMHALVKLQVRIRARQILS